MAAEESDAIGKLGLGAALAASVVAAGLLLSWNYSFHQRVVNLRGAKSVVPVLGSAQGWMSGGAGEWKAAGDDPQVVLFDLSASGSEGDLHFWREIARESAKYGSHFQFVGRCAEESICDAASTVAASDDGITILTSMDPIQLRALALASEKGKALVYRGNMLRAELTITDGTQAIAGKLAELEKSMSEGRKQEAEERLVDALRAPGE